MGLPPTPSSLRVKVWRRLQALGAVAVKNTVYALPASEQSQEDFAWLLKEIVEAGGEAIVCGLGFQFNIFGQLVQSQAAEAGIRLRLTMRIIGMWCQPSDRTQPRLRPSPARRANSRDVK